MTNLRPVPEGWRGGVLLYFAWSRPAETEAPLTAIDNRFPALFELRRLFYPRFEAFAEAGVDQGIAGFLDHVQRPNFAAFANHAEVLTGRRTRVCERLGDDRRAVPLEAATIAGASTLVIISFDSLRTGQAATSVEVEAVRAFLADPEHLVVVAPHHDIGAGEPVTAEGRQMEHRHHGDMAIPPRQGFGAFARTLLAGLGAPVDNRFGLRPAVEADGEPAPILAAPGLDRLGLLTGVRTFNAHPHLPHLERIDGGLSRLEVLARQRIEPSAPPHVFQIGGRTDFDALLQSKAEAFAGTLLVGDATLFSGTAGGLDQLRRFWTNLLRRPRAGASV